MDKKIDAVDTEIEKTLFDNTYTPTLQDYKEIAFFQIFFRKMYIFLNIFSISVIILAVIISIVLHDASELLSVPFVFFYLAFIYMNLLVIIRYRRSIKMWLKRREECPEIIQEFTYSIIDCDGIKISLTDSQGAKTQTQNLKIKRVYQTKNFFMLWSEANLLYIFKKGAFTKGTDDEFRGYLRSKGFKIK